MVSLRSCLGIRLCVIVSLGNQVVRMCLGLGLSLSVHHRLRLQVLRLCRFFQRLGLGLEALRLHSNLHCLWL